MLGYKNRMIFHGRLSSIVGGIGWCQTSGHKITGMVGYHTDTLCIQIVIFLCCQPKTAAEFRTIQRFKKLIYISHKLINTINTN